MCTCIFTTMQVIIWRKNAQETMVWFYTCTYTGYMRWKWNVDIGFSLISMIKYFKSVFFFKYSHFTLFDFFGQNTEYKGEYYRQHPTIRLFWEVFHELTIQLKKKFLCKCCRKERIKRINVSNNFVLTCELIPGHRLHLQSDALPVWCSTSELQFQWYPQTWVRRTSQNSEPFKFLFL